MLRLLQNVLPAQPQRSIQTLFVLQEEAVQYVATTVDRLLKEQQAQGLKRVYVISTYVIGKERLLVAIHKLTGCRIGVTQQKMDTMKCLELPGAAHSYAFSSQFLEPLC